MESEHPPYDTNYAVMPTSFFVSAQHISFISFFFHLYVACDKFQTFAF